MESSSGGGNPSDASSFIERHILHGGAAVNDKERRGVLHHAMCQISNATGGRVACTITGVVLGLNAQFSGFGPWGGGLLGPLVRSLSVGLSVGREGSGALCGRRRQPLKLAPSLRTPLGPCAVKHPRFFAVGSEQENWEG